MWHMTQVGEIRNAYRIFVRKLEGSRPFGDIAIGRWTVLKWFLKKQSMMLWIEFMTQHRVLWWAPMNVIMTI